MGIKKFYLETYGCQMNEYDSHLVESLLVAAGYEKVADENSADLVILNTCSVRQKAEERALGRIRSISSRQSPREIAVIGCMAQRMGQKLLKINPHVKYVLGTGSFHRVVDLISGSNGSPLVDISCRDKPFDVQTEPLENKISRYVTIMRGCDNFCSYCIVPYVRGRERYRSPERILSEINRFENSGCREIWLLGQNVNSYRFDDLDFPELLELVCGKTAIPRLRFLTSHPKDFSGRLIEVMAAYPKICKGIHLPLQSGSDRVLERMNRKYTSGQYLGKVLRLKEKIPEVVITTDIIVGFPGETEADYLATRELMEKIEFNSAFMFRYSVRDGTKAEQFEDDVPEKEKLDRLDDLIKFQKKISESKMAALIGSAQNVLLEQTAKQNDHDALGKTDGGANVVVREASSRLGEIVRVRINSSSYTTLVGEIITQ
jgi:tRNA-2-methylthio-N6-dimethylallyladenosine synthase